MRIHFRMCGILRNRYIASATALQFHKTVLVKKPGFYLKSQKNHPRS